LLKEEVLESERSVEVDVKLVPRISKEKQKEIWRTQFDAEFNPRPKGKRHYDGKRSDSVGGLFTSWPKTPKDLDNRPSDKHRNLSRKSDRSSEYQRSYCSPEKQAKAFGEIVPEKDFVLV
jgi:hypothetical protein